MGVQITKQANFIKINVTENTDASEVIHCIEEFDESLKSKVYGGMLCADSNYWIVTPKQIYIFRIDNRYYAICFQEGEVVINRRTIFDEQNPNENFKNQELSTDEYGDISEYDKSFHIDDSAIIIYTIKKEYELRILKHGLFHHSTFYGRSFNSEYVKDHSKDPSDSIVKRMLLNKNGLLKMAQEIIEDIKNVENIETIMDLSVFELLPAPSGMQLIKTKNNLY